MVKKTIDILFTVNITDTGNRLTFGSYTPCFLIHSVVCNTQVLVLDKLWPEEAQYRACAAGRFPQTDADHWAAGGAQRDRRGPGDGQDLLGGRVARRAVRDRVGGHGWQQQENTLQRWEFIYLFNNTYSLFSALLSQDWDGPREKKITKLGLVCHALRSTHHPPIQPPFRREVNIKKQLSYCDRFIFNVPSFGDLNWYQIVRIPLGCDTHLLY